MSEYITEFFGSSSGGSYTERREEIVRCKDCKYYEEYSSEYWCTQHDIMTLKDMSDGFCSWGERRNESLVEFIEQEGRKRDTND